MADLFYPKVKGPKGDLVPGGVDDALRRAYDMIYRINKRLNLGDPSTPSALVGNPTMYSGTLYPVDERPIGLTADQINVTFWSTDFANQYRWNGSDWDVMNPIAYVAYFNLAPTTGWALADGTSVRATDSHGITSVITLPSATGRYLKGDTSVSTSSATAPTISGSTAADGDHAHTGSTGSESTHTHAVTGNTASDGLHVHDGATNTNTEETGLALAADDTAWLPDLSHSHAVTGSAIGLNGFSNPVTWDVDYCSIVNSVEGVFPYDVVACSDMSDFISDLNANFALIFDEIASSTIDDHETEVQPLNINNSDHPHHHHLSGGQIEITVPNTSSAHLHAISFASAAGASHLHSISASGTHTHGAGTLTVSTTGVPATITLLPYYKL